MANTTISSFSRLSGIWFSGILAATAHMVGEFFREAAVLLTIFVPLEIWKSKNGILDIGLLWHVGEGCLVIFFVGLCAEFFALGANRIKRDLEVANGSE